MTKLTAEVTVDVPFHDVDVMEVVWHGHYIKYFEYARTALLRRIGYDYAQMRASGYAWPVVECYLKYIRPARYGQRLVVRASLREAENRLKIDYEIADSATGQRLTKGFTVQVAVDLRDNALQFVSPPCLTELLENPCAS